VTGEVGIQFNVPAVTLQKQLLSRVGLLPTCQPLTVCSGTIRYDTIRYMRRKSDKTVSFI